MAISFVDGHSAFTQSNNTVTITGPTGVASGDVLIGAVGFLKSGTSSQTFTVPTGWTKVREYTTSNETLNTHMLIMKKIAGGSEPSSYTVTTSGATNMAGMGYIAGYRGSDGNFIAENIAQDPDSDPMTTPTLNNTQSTAWRITVGACNLPLTAGYPATSEAKVRVYNDALNFTAENRYLGFIYADSNGPVASGNTSRTISLDSGNWDSAVAWIGVLHEGSATPATGTFECTLPGLGPVAASGELTVTSSADLDLPSLGYEFAGSGPTDADGVLAAPLSLPAVSLTAATEPRGALAIGVLPRVRFSTETVPFGVRVILVAAESRTTIVPSRGVDD